MKGKSAKSYWWSTTFLLQMAFMMAVTSNAKQCTRTGSSFTVLGVFDGNDAASILNFRKAIEVLDNLVAKKPGCTPKVTHRELTLHDQMSALEVINATRNVFLGEKICYVIYSSYGRNGQLLLDYAIKNRIPVVSTIPKKVYNARDKLGTHYFDPAKVINLNVRSTRSTKVQVIVDFLFQEKYKEFVAITGADVDDMSMISSLREAIKQRSLVMVDWFIVPGSSDVASRMAGKIMSLRSQVTIFLIITNDMRLAETIVYKTRELPYNVHSWIIVTDVMDDTNFPMDVHIIYPVIRGNLTKTDYIEDAIGMLGASLKEWIIIPSGRCPVISEIQGHLPKVEFSGKTGFVKFNDEKQRVHGRYEISTRNPERRIQSKTLPVGNFNKGVLKKIATAYSKQVVKITVIEYAPYVMIHPKIPNEPCEPSALSCFKKISDGTEKMSCCNGFVIDVIGMIRLQVCQILGSGECFDIRLIFNDDGMYGIRLNNGSWNGVVNDVITEQVDMSADLFPNMRRSEVLDFTDVYMPTGIALLVKESKRQQSKIYWTSYMRPFTSTLWFFFAGSVGVMIAFLWIVEKFGPSRTDGKLFDWRTAFRLDNAVCYVLQLAFGRPADEKKPMSNGARLTGLMFGIAMMILMASYSANLAAFLIVSDLATPVDSIYDEKIKNPPPGFTYGTIEGSYMASFFSTTDIEYFRKIWPNMKKNSVKSLSEGVKKVSSGELDVLIGDSVSMQYSSLDDPYCELKVVGEPFAMSGPSFAVKKGSSRLPLLATALRKMQAKGLTTFIQKSWVKKFKCQKEVLPVQLPFKDLSGLFLQLLIGIILCILGTSCHLGWNHMYLGYRKCGNKKKEEIEENIDINTSCTYEFQTFKETNI